MDAHHVFNTSSFQRVGDTDVYEMKLPRSGGGWCQWRLSNTRFYMVHGNPGVYGADVAPGGGSGIVINFDRGGNQQSGSDDLVFKQDYYPWINEGFLGGYRKRIIVTSGIYLDKNYHVGKASSIYFEPAFHAGFVLRSQGPKVKRDGVYTTYTYPDGSIYSDGKWHPNMSRLQAIREAAEAKKLIDAARKK
ncbi:hypothetical protein ACIPL1_09830 [Pseudomonas sp. NPDC090202]|uniref:hypothetical protein n=1 Tax=unclassified Pseudomonas TaxID=196821 RepID=UPI003815F387